MLDDTHASPRAPSEELDPRLIARYSGERPGPEVVCIGSLHGNEPAGVAALQRVAKALKARAPVLRGRWTALLGNRRAAAAGVRALGGDLNRQWTAESVRDWLSREPESAEEQDRVELLRALAPCLARGTGPAWILDLHSTSAPGQPFTAMADVLRNRPLAARLGLPTILGLEEAIPGSLVGWLCEAGHIGLAIEGGSHLDAASIDHHEAAIWLSLVQSGALERKAAPDGLEERLAAGAAGLPPFFEILHRHVIPSGSRFIMQPGFTNFDGVQRGQELAEEDGRLLRAPYEATLLLPRYQPEGEDGYFLARPVRPFWLALSKLLRKLGADRLVPFLPGVQRDPEDPLHRRLFVDPSVARVAAIGIMHLFGYRRAPGGGERLVFHRRAPTARQGGGLPPEMSALAER